MKITFCCTGTKAEPWLAGLRAALPQAQVERLATRRAAGRLRRGVGAAATVPRRAAAAQGPVQHRRRRGCPAEAAPAAPAPAVVRLDDARHVGADGRVRVPCGDPPLPRIRRLRGRHAARAAGRTASRAAARTSRSASWAWACWANAWRRPLAQFEFPVNGWSRTAKNLDGVRGFAGAAAVRRVSGGQPHAGVPAAAHRRDAGHHEPRHPVAACSPAAT